MGSDRNHSRFQSGLYRWNGGQRRIAEYPARAECHGCGRAMGGGIICALSRCAYLAGRRCGRLIWTPSGIYDWRISVRRRIRAGAASPRHTAPDRSPRFAGSGRSYACAGKPGDHQRSIPDRSARQGNRHMVRIHRNHCGHWACPGRMARAAFFLALGILHQSSHCCGSHRDFFSVCSGKLWRKQQAQARYSRRIPDYPRPRPARLRHD